MRALLSEAVPRDVLCGPFDADPEYYIILSNIERFYWGRPFLPVDVARLFVERLGDTVLVVEWRCSVVAKLPALVIVDAR